MAVTVTETNKRPAHQHVCLLCGAEWACRNRCKGDMNRLCWKCLKHGLEQTEHLQ